MSSKTTVLKIFPPLQTTNVAYCERKIQLSGFSAYLAGSATQFIRISGVLLHKLPVADETFYSK